MVLRNFERQFLLVIVLRMYSFLMDRLVSAMMVFPCPVSTIMILRLGH